ncbi:hypothetical protein DB347_25225 [Opitutaceae bacterium EW11]|nr:hypothetical protein DB347_25225 [Opitutaceae bacterium EW11]
MNANTAKGQTTAAAGDAFVVWKADQNSDGSSRANGMWNIGGDDMYTWRTDGQLYEGFGTATRYSTGVPVQPVNRYHMYNVSAQAGNWINRIDGQTQYRSAANTVGWSNAPTLGRANYSPLGDIAEIIIYDRILTDIEREAVCFYLNRKYSLVLAITLTGRFRDCNLDGFTDEKDVGLAVDPYELDADHDGVPNFVELSNGTDPLNSDTDRDSVMDGIDAYPLDPARSTIPVADPNDHTGPTVTLTTPSEATLG